MLWPAENEFELQPGDGKQLILGCAQSQKIEQGKGQPTTNDVVYISMQDIQMSNTMLVSQSPCVAEFVATETCMCFTLELDN